MNYDAFDLMLKNALQSRPDFNLFDIDYDYSPAKISRKTEKYINKLEKTMFCSPSKLKTSPRRRIRYVVAAVIGASLLAVGAVAYSSKFLFSQGDNGMDYISIQSNAEGETRIEEIYELTYNLEGYKLTEYIEWETEIYSLYNKNKSYVLLEQNIAGSRMMIDTEDVTFETVTINGNEALYIDSSSETGYSQLLIWTYDGYEFYLSCGTLPGERDFEKEQLIEMAQTIQIKN